MLRRRLEETIGSPLALLAALGVGFAVGRFGPFRKTAPAAPGQRGDRLSLIATVMDGLTLAGSLIALLPKASPVPADRITGKPGQAG